MEEAVSEGLHLMERTHQQQFTKNCSLVGGTHSGELHRGLSAVGRTPCWSKGKRENTPSSQEEEATERRCDEMIAIPYPCPPVPLEGRREITQE